MSDILNFGIRESKLNLYHAYKNGMDGSIICIPINSNSLLLYFLVLKELIKIGACNKQCKNRPLPSSLFVQDVKQSPYILYYAKGMPRVCLVSMCNLQVSVTYTKVITSEKLFGEQPFQSVSAHLSAQLGVLPLFTMDGCESLF
jgi:hypothetical protein